MLCALALVRPVAAQSVKLAWDASPSPGVTNYVIYAATNALATLTNISVGTNLTATVENLSPGTWRFYATAQAGGVESAPSNLLLVDVPRPPANLRTIVVQYSYTLTNWADLGFFRLRVP